MNSVVGDGSNNGIRARLLLFGVCSPLGLRHLLPGWFICRCFSYGAYVQRAARQQQRTIEISPQRGIIYDRNGQELAMSVQVDSVYAVPVEIPDQENTATILASVLNGDAEEILERMKSQKNFAWVARKIDARNRRREFAP